MALQTVFVRLHTKFFVSEVEWERPKCQSGSSVSALLTSPREKGRVEHLGR